MPYGYRKSGDKITVFKKDTGKVVGHTTPGKLKDYLAALHIHANENVVTGDCECGCGGACVKENNTSKQKLAKLIESVVRETLREDYGMSEFTEYYTVTELGKKDLPEPLKYHGEMYFIDSKFIHVYWSESEKSCYICLRNANKFLEVPCDNIAELKAIAMKYDKIFADSQEEFGDLNRKSVRAKGINEHISQYSMINNRIYERVDNVWKMIPLPESDGSMKKFHIIGLFLDDEDSPIQKIFDIMAKSLYDVYKQIDKRYPLDRWKKLKVDMI